MENAPQSPEPGTPGTHRKRTPSVKRGPHSRHRLKLVDDPYPAELVDHKNTIVTRVRAKWDFESRNPAELEFKAGDIIVITAQGAKGEGWWEGRLIDSENKQKNGLIPVNRVEVLEILEKERKLLKINTKSVSCKILAMQQMLGAPKAEDAKEEGKEKEEKEDDSPNIPVSSPSPPIEASPLGPKRRRRVSLQLSTEAQKKEYLGAENLLQTALSNVSKSPLRPRPHTEQSTPEKSEKESDEEKSKEESNEESDDNDESSILSSSSSDISSDEEGTEEEDESEEEPEPIGPIKFSYAELQESGILIDSKIPKGSQKKATFIISSNDGGKSFVVSGSIAGEVTNNAVVVVDDFRKLDSETVQLDMGVVHTVMKVILTIQVQKLLQMIDNLLS